MSITVLIDAGSSRVRVGFEGDAAPRSVVPTTAAGGQPIQAGQIVDQTAWAALVKYITNSALGTDPVECMYIVSVAPGSSKAARQMAGAGIMSNLRAAGVYVCSSPIFAASSQGIDTAVVVDLGHELTSVTPIAGCVIQFAGLATLPLSGREIEKNVQSLLAKKGTQVDQPTAHALKEALCYVAPDSAQADSGPCLGSAATTVGGKSYTLAAERYRAPEILFRTQLAGSAADGLHLLTYNAVMTSDLSFRKAMYANVILCGGSSLLPGLADRLQREVQSLAPAVYTVTVRATPDRDQITWKGMNTAAASLSRAEWVTAMDFSTSGPSIINQKCLR